MLSLQNLSAEERKQLLSEAKTIAVVGLSNKPDRDSYHVAEYLQKQGYKIIPVNPTVDEVLGEKAVASLADIKEAVDIVDVFRRSDQVMPIAKEAASIGAKAMWLQLGVSNEEAESYAREQGLKVVSNLCIMVDHRQLMK